MNFRRKMGIIMQNVHVTGVGIISSLGIGRDQNKEKIFLGKDSVTKNTSVFKSANIIECFDAEQYFPQNFIRRMEKFSKLLLTSSKFSIEDAKIAEDLLEDFGSIFSTYWGPLEITEKYFKELISLGPKKASPILFPSTVTNASLGRVAMKYRLKNISSFFVGMCPIEYSYEIIRNNKINGVLCGACDVIFKTNYDSFSESGFLEEKPVSILDALTSENKGFSLGEGVITFILESDEGYKKRGGRQYCRICSINSFYIPLILNPISSVEAVERMSRIIKKTISDANIDVEEIDCIISCANSDSKIIEMEKKALESAFRQSKKKLPVIFPKENLGEIPGVGSSLSLYSALEILNGDLVPANIIYDRGEYARKDKFYCENIRTVLCNSFVIGSNMTSMIVTK
jgi:3-oxoacyl-[acyl-carrier-protein] synthase II